MGLFDFFKKGKENKKVEQKNSVLLENMAAKLGYPYKIIPEMSAAALTEFYRRELERGKRGGFIPVIIAEDSCLNEYFDILKNVDMYDIKEELKKIDAGSERLTMTLEDVLGEEINDEDSDFDIDEFIGETAGGEEINAFMSVFSYEKPVKMMPCALLEVPAENPWETVVYVPFGGWNDCPAPAEMAAVCKVWYEKYGAVPAVITHDTLEFVLEKPVPQAEAAELAMRQYIFCGDRVDQCSKTGTLGELADSLSKSKVWYFWWD